MNSTRHLGCCSTSVAGGVALMPARTLILRLQLQLNKLNTEMVKAFLMSLNIAGGFNVEDVVRVRLRSFISSLRAKSIAN
jgi:hypothetical protein